MLVVYLILLSIALSSSHSRCPADQPRDDRPDLDTYYESPSGHFWIHYDLSGDNAPNSADNNNNSIPDYVESAAEAADSARFVLTNTMLYIDEENDDDGKYDIYILELDTSGNLWGNCQKESGGGSFIRIRNTYQGMSDFCSNETELLWLTVGHEFFHAIQYAYRSNSSDSYFRELTSMWFENIFVPNCYDFLDFVDSGSGALFNAPGKGFDDNTSGNVGYSLALYGHYLSNIIDQNQSDDQMSTTIIREIWEDYSQGGTIFQSVRDVLENNIYNTTFQKTWIDFMSSNMFCGEYDNMNNDMYYHIGQSYIDPPNIDYEALIGNTTISSNAFIQTDRVFIAGYEATDQYRINTEFSSSSESWHGYLLTNNTVSDISNIESYDFFSINNSNRLILIFANEDGVDDINYVLNINIEGCMEYNAINYNPNAVINDGSCKFPDANNLISIYPNPINLKSSSLNVIYDRVDAGDINIDLYDIRGRLIFSKIFPSLSGRQHLDYNIDRDISSGIYFLRFSSNENVEVIKFINMR